MPPTTNDGRMEQLWRECLGAPSREEYIKKLSYLITAVKVEAETTKYNTIARFLEEIPVIGGDSELFERVRQLGEHCGISATISACTAWLKQLKPNRKEAQTKSSLTSCLLMIEYSLQLASVDNQAADDDVSTSSFWDDHVQIQDLLEHQVFLLPQLISNACFSLDVPLPDWTTHQSFYPYLVSRSCIPEKHPRIRLFSILLFRLLLRKRKADMLALGIRQYTESSPSESSQSHINSLLLESIKKSTSIEKAQLVHSLVVKHCLGQRSRRQPLERTCAAIAQSTYATSEEYLSLIINDKSSMTFGLENDKHLEQQLAPLEDLVDDPSNEADSSSDDDDSTVGEEETTSMFRRHLIVLAETWGASRMEDQRELYLTKLILCGLDKLPPPKRPELESGSKLILTLFQGVTHRLESPNQYIRSQGIKVAKILAYRLGQILDIEDPVDEDLYPSDPPEAKAIPSKSHPLSETKAANEKSVLDPDADYVSSDEEESSVPDSPGSLVKNIALEDDEEDLIGTYLYLKDILGVLRGIGENTDEPVEVENAMKQMPGLIQSRPDDLYDISVSLALELVRMENKFALTTFDDLRKESLVSLLVEEPIIVGQSLIECMFQGSESSFENRLLILTVMQDAADQLSRVDRSPDAEIPSIERKSGVAQGRLGRSRQKNSRSSQKVKYFRNDFVSVGPLWFYPVLEAFKANKEDQAIWSGTSGSIFLSGLFLTLANFAENSGTEAGVLAKDLFLLSWSFVDADEANVRSAVLVAISSCLTSLPREIAEHLLTNAGVQLQIQRMATNEKDTTCRQLATGLTNLLEN